MLKFARLNDAFLKVFWPQASPVGQSLQQKEKKRRKRKAKKKIPKIEKPKDLGHFLVQKQSQNFDSCTCPSHIVVKHDAGGKKGKLLCCNTFSTGLRLIWPRSSLKSTKMSKKHIFSQKVPGVNGLMYSWGVHFTWFDCNWRPSCKKGVYQFCPIFTFCRIGLILGRPTCFDMKSIVP